MTGTNEFISGDLLFQNWAYWLDSDSGVTLDSSSVFGAMAIPSAYKKPTGVFKHLEYDADRVQERFNAKVAEITDLKLARLRLTHRKLFRCVYYSYYLRQTDIEIGERLQLHRNTVRTYRKDAAIIIENAVNKEIGVNIVDLCA